MKKLKVFVVAVCLIIAANEATAQKIGYIDLETVISVMPEAGKIDTLLQMYQQDSVNSQFKMVMEDYTYKDSLLNKADTSKMPSGVKQQIRHELNGLISTIQNWQGLAERAMQAKQAQLVQPLYKKAYAALQAAAKEGGYTQVVTRDAFLIAPTADDLFPAVAKKLGIKLPPQYKPGIMIGQGN